MDPFARVDQILAEYEALPESVKSTLSFLEYRWLSGPERHALIATETEPETFND